jgi:nitroimidazol reductase NimA-like FMN-containing flavoprotein (pyridoxamine 5'-phosphate oxidase superfamily)
MMRRKEKEITERSEIETVIRKSVVCRVGLSCDNIPYIVPMCFGYQDNAIYVHSSMEGSKIAILQKNNNVCFEFDGDTEIVQGDQACAWGMRYRSVIGFGSAYFLKEPEEKRKALEVIMAHYSDLSFEFPEKSINRTAVIKIAIQSMTGKKSGM